jgi:hypothetical protein
LARDVGFWGDGVFGVGRGFEFGERREVAGGGFADGCPARAVVRRA